jgi:hypothetical protein
LLDIKWIKVCIAFETAPQLLRWLAEGFGALGHSSSSQRRAGALLLLLLLPPTAPAFSRAMPAVVFAAWGKADLMLALHTIMLTWCCSLQMLCKSCTMLLRAQLIVSRVSRTTLCYRVNRKAQYDGLCSSHIGYCAPA